MFNVDQLNEMLSKVNFEPYYKPNHALERQIGSQNVPDDGDGRQGECNTFFDIYKTPDPKIFLRATVNTDSYGEEYKVVKLDFVQAVPKTVTVYEVVQ